MPWNDLANNQMVSFTDAQTSGFSLKPGQSQVTSNQCMTKDEITTKYYVAVSGYSGNQLVPKSDWAPSSFIQFRSLERLTSGSVCVFGLTYPNTSYTAEQYVVLGTIVYDNEALTIPFNGNDFWFGFAATSGAAYQINSSGQVIDEVNCGF
jgi:hypothetical protein